RISGNGGWIGSECGPDLWLVSAHGGSPRKLAIEVHADDKQNPEHTETFTQGAAEYALSYDEKHVVGQGIFGGALGERLGVLGVLLVVGVDLDGELARRAAVRRHEPEVGAALGADPPTVAADA